MSHLTFAFYLLNKYLLNAYYVPDSALEGVKWRAGHRLLDHGAS
jgi:hypothetical protein